MNIFFRMYLGKSKGFISPKEITFFKRGVPQTKLTKALIRREEDGKQIEYEPLLIAEFSDKLLDGRPLETARDDLINFFQNFFLTQTNGLKLQDFFVTAIEPIAKHEKVILKFSFENVEVTKNTGEE